MKLNGNRLIFETTGREISAHKLVIGINPISEVYGVNETGISKYDCSFTSDEAQELGNYMIGLWDEFIDVNNPK